MLANSEKLKDMTKLDHGINPGLCWQICSNSGAMTAPSCDIHLTSAPELL